MPRAVASDLRRFFDIHIRDWHQGRLSSFELIELFGVRIIDDHETQTRTITAEYAPEDGAVDRVIREGGFNRVETLLAELFNETARSRASLHVAFGGNAYEPPEIVDPRVERERELLRQLSDAEKREVAIEIGVDIMEEDAPYRST